MTRLRNRRTQRGLSLVEVLISTGLLVGGGGALLVGMSQSAILADYLVEQQVAWNAAQAKLADLITADDATGTGFWGFDALATGPRFIAARSSAGQVACIGEDLNCSGTVDRGDGEVDSNGNGLADVMPNGRLCLQIRPVTRQDGTTELFASATMLDLHVAASWRSRGRCIGGEDRNCNGQMDPGEDTNGNGWLDTPVMLSTRVARKELRQF